MKKKTKITLILLILSGLILLNILMINHWIDAVAVMLGGLIVYVSQYFLKKNK
jgi:hypothetical protein